MSGEKLFPVAAAVEKETGHRPHAATCHRWRLTGIRNVRLETVLLGGRRMTSREAVRRFLAATTRAADGGPAPRSATPRQRERQIAAAEKELDALGV